MNMLLPLLPAKARPYAKAWLAALGTILSVASILIPADPKWVTVGISALTALGVYAQPNATAVKIAQDIAAVKDAATPVVADVTAQVDAVIHPLPLPATVSFGDTTPPKPAA